MNEETYFTYIQAMQQGSFLEALPYTNVLLLLLHHGQKCQNRLLAYKVTLKKVPLKKEVILYTKHKM